MKETWVWEIKMIVQTVEMLEVLTLLQHVVADDEKTAISMATELVFRFDGKEGITLLKLDSAKKVHSVWIKGESGSMAERMEVENHGHSSRIHSN